MKNKDVKSLLKTKASEIEISDKRNDILNKVELKPIPQKEKSSNKKWIPLIPAIAATFVAITVAILIPQMIDNTTGNISSLSLAKQKLSFEVAALGNAIHTPSTASSLRRARIDQTQANEIANDVHDYLLTGEMMLNQENIIAYNTLNTNPDYDYQYVMEVSYIDFQTYLSSYTLYYNEVASSTDYDDIDEVNSSIEGIMIIDENEYVVKGSKEVEKDEIETTLSIYKTETSYITVSQEIENKENEYEYTYVEDGDKIKTLSLEVENNAFGKEMSISIEQANIEKEYDFEYFKKYINCEFESNDEEYKIKIENYKDYYLYIFDSETKISITK